MMEFVKWTKAKKKKQKREKVHKEIVPWNLLARHDIKRCIFPSIENRFLAVRLGREKKKSCE